VVGVGVVVMEVVFPETKVFKVWYMVVEICVLKMKSKTKTR
jgi:hypothetical protein